MYNESHLDRANRNWFAHDNSINSLKKIKVSSGHIRGVYPSEINFTYPITAIVGENGSGKSTYLSLVACAFHNSGDFCPSNRVRPGVQNPRKYYTYSDFLHLHQKNEESQEFKFKQTIKLRVELKVI